MPVYVWKGTNFKNKKRKGKLEAVDTKQVESYLKRLRISDYAIKEAPKDLSESFAILQPKVKAKDVMLFTRQFLTMIDAGLPLVQCLKILADQADNSTFKKALRDINTNVQSGTTLSDALRRHPKIFDELYTNLIAAGETAGILDVILLRLADYIEKSEKLKRKVKGAMVYPIAVVLIACGVIAVILIFVIPKFNEIFESFNIEMPALTQIVLNASGFAVNNVHWILLFIIAFFFTLSRIVKTKKGKYIFDDFLLKIPVIGNLIRKVAVARFCRTLSTMIQAGVPIISSMEIVARTSGNKIIEEVIFDSRNAIAEGRALTDPLLESGVFPPMVTQMISVGEESGALDSMLNKIADFYDDEVDAAVEAMTALIEPVLIVVLGVIVGVLIIAMYLPIFKMASGLAQ